MYARFVGGRAIIMGKSIQRIQRNNRKILLFAFLIVALAGCIRPNISFALHPAELADDGGSDIQKKLKTASVQHELILLLIENKAYDQVEVEWKKVLDLKLGTRYEAPIASSLLTIGYKLYEAKQLVVAQKLMDASLASVPFANKSRADIFKFKAFLFKEAGDLENAIRSMRIASDLVEKN
jgi:hypothetical protein